MTTKELKELAKKKSQPLIFEADMSIYIHGFEEGYLDAEKTLFTKDDLHEAFRAGKIFERSGINIFEDIIKNKK
jgi:hypothetical protein